MKIPLFQRGPAAARPPSLSAPDGLLYSDSTSERLIWLDKDAGLWRTLAVPVWRHEINPFLGGIVVAGTWAPVVSTALLMNGWMLNSSNAQNDEIAFDVGVSPGTYALHLLHSKLATGAIFSVRVDNIEVGTIDSYAASAAHNQRSSATGILLLEGGKYRLSFKAAARNASSTGWHLPFYLAALVKTA